MADDKAARLRAPRESLPGLATPENRRGMAESSTTGSLLGAPPAPDQPLPLAGRDSLDDSSLNPGSSATAPARQGERARIKRPRHRSGRGFLLSALGPGPDDSSHRRSAREAIGPKAQTLPAPRTPEPDRSNAERDIRHRMPSDVTPRQSTTTPQTSRGRSSGESDSTNPGANQYSQPQTPPGLDTDSAQIVRMALSLSESRRAASWRNVSGGTPPRLATLPGGSSGSNLRHHLQQQRRLSRNMSPNLNSYQSPGIPSLAGLNSTLLPALDPGQDGQYRYHFSSSTLSRSQRAKEHLELMAECRRLLEALSPLKPGFERHATASPPPGSPAGNKTGKIGPYKYSAPPLGRQYNPLQYIRNRKVRARERKVIDGERQGFGDVESVRLWVDEICQRSSSLDVHSGKDDPVMPVFRGADGPECQTSPGATVSRAAARVRRPRVDWFIEPCDMVADAYWLEQNDHKHLIEDRQWRKIYPPVADIFRPVSRETESLKKVVSPLSLQTESPHDTEVFGITKVDTDLSSSSARDRARQKIQNIRTFPHRHGGSSQGQHQHQHHDFMRMKKDSVSDLSDSENESRSESRRRMRLGRSGTLTSNTNDLLEKQMLEMVAKEAREREIAGAAAENPFLETFHGRKESVADTSDSDRKDVRDRPRQGSAHRHRPGQQGLDATYWPSKQPIGNSSPLPTSPKLQASKDNSAEPGIDTWKLSAQSRPGSPGRNPLSKVKQIIRDKNNDTCSGNHLSKNDQDGDGRPSAKDSTSPLEKASAPNWRQSSPIKGPASERPPESWKMHRRSGSLRLQPDDQGLGLRGILRGPRLDTVIRGGVSKLGGILLRRDGPSELPAEVGSTEEVEGERARGRQAPSPTRAQDDVHRPSKHILDSMADLNHNHGIHHSRSSGREHTEETPSGSASHSHLSSRFDLLKPPRIDIRSASPSVSPAVSKKTRLGESDVSESESGSWQSSVPRGDRDIHKHPDAMGPAGPDGNRLQPSWHWSIADKDCSTEQARLSRREIARMRALILSSGIKAMELDRRAKQHCKLFSDEDVDTGGGPMGKGYAGIEWADIAQLSPGKKKQLRGRKVAYCELYPLAARTLARAIQASDQQLQASADRFATETSPDLQRRIGDARSRLVDDLSEMTRRAADEADEINRDLAFAQPLKVKHVVDTIERMLRRRRRRFRWVRRVLWLMVEWLLVGFIWYVWFVVVILRILLGLGKGVWRGVMWLLWM